MSGISNKHGWRFTRTYESWHSMKSRCLNKNNKDFYKYGGRGIGVCDEWLEFLGFLADMGERPAGMSLDRADNDGGYNPSNCRWATPVDQVRNRSNTIWLEYDGEKKPISVWAKDLGVSDMCLRHRLYKMGMSVVEALSKPSRRKRRL